MKRNALRIILIIAICFGVGYGFGRLIGECMKKNKIQKDYIGASVMQIENGKMTPEALLALGRISDPQLSPDGSEILFGVSYNSVEQNRSCRNLYVCNVDGSNRRQLTCFGKSVSNARWSKDGDAIWFLQSGQMYKAAYKNDKLGKKVKMSDVEAGISEFSISPDGNSVMYISTVKGPVKTPADFDPALDKAGAYVAEDLMYRHWDHWVTETPRTFIASLQNGKVTADNSFDILGGQQGFELPTEPFGGMDQLCWSPDSRHIAYSCRKKTGTQYAFSTDSEIYIYDILTGCETLIPMGGGYDTDPHWSEDGSRIAWLSMERDGYEADRTRIMVAEVFFDDSSEGQNAEAKVSAIRELTSGFDRDAAGLLWKGDNIYFSSITDGLQAIFRTDLKGNITRLTKDEWWYDFSSPFAVMGEAGSEKMLASYYSLQFPTEFVCIDCEEMTFKQITNENGHLLSQIGENRCEKEFVETVDGKQMLTWVLYPTGFDSTKTYPAILITLGGPQGTLSQDWSYRWCYRLMAQQGYIVIMPNRRGTTAFGQEWKEQISGDYPGLNMQDYMSAAKEFKSRDYVGKIAACGASYGGYSVYNLAGIHGDLFDCFIAHAGIFDENAMWFSTEEMWFPNWDNGGLGEGDSWGGICQGGAPYSKLPKAVRHYAQSPDRNVQNWHTPILCIHGGMDFRIPYEQGLSAFNAAKMMGVPAKLVVFPEECHWILQPQNAIFWHRTYFDWLDKWTKQ